MSVRHIHSMTSGQTALVRAAILPASRDWAKTHSYVVGSITLAVAMADFARDCYIGIINVVLFHRGSDRYDGSRRNGSVSSSTRSTSEAEIELKLPVSVAVSTDVQDGRCIAQCGASLAVTSSSSTQERRTASSIDQPSSTQRRPPRPFGKCFCS